MRRLLFGAGVLLAVVLQRPQVIANEPPASVQLDVGGGQRQKVTNHQEAARAEARGQLALAVGKKRPAAAEFREVVAYREAQLTALQARRGQICDVRTLADAEGELAVARAGLAEAEGNFEGLAEVLPDVVRYHQSRIAFVRDLSRLGAIGVEEEVALLREHYRALLRAQVRLKQLQGQQQRRKDGKANPAPGSPR